MVNPELVAAVVNKLARFGRIFVQTDISCLAEEICESVRSDKRMIEKGIEENPFPVKTEREMAVEDRGLAIYRTMFEKSS